MALIKEYFELTKRYQDDYGENTLVEISEGFSTLSVAYNFFRDNINCWKLNKKELMI